MNLSFNVSFFSFSGNLVQMEKKTSEDFVQKYVENSVNPKDVIMSAYYFRFFLKYKAILTACGLCVIKRESGQYGPVDLG